MSIRFATPARARHCRIAAAEVALICWQGANDNHPAGKLPGGKRGQYGRIGHDRVGPARNQPARNQPGKAQAANDQPAQNQPAMPLAALRHFATHGLRAVAAASTAARTCLAAGDMAGFAHWQAICHAFDARVADALLQEARLADGRLQDGARQAASPAAPAALGKLIG